MSTVYETEPMSEVKAKMFMAWHKQQIGGQHLHLLPPDNDNQIIFVCTHLDKHSAAAVAGWEIKNEDIH